MWGWLGWCRHFYDDMFFHLFDHYSILLRAILAVGWVIVREAKLYILQYAVCRKISLPTEENGSNNFEIQLPYYSFPSSLLVSFSPAYKGSTIEAVDYVTDLFVEQIS